MSVRAENTTTTPMERCRQNLRHELKIAADLLKESLLKAHGHHERKGRPGHPFIFSNDASDEENLKVWDSIRDDWRDLVKSAINEALPILLREYKRRTRQEREAEEQGAFVGKLFARAVIEAFSLLTSERVLILTPSGLGEAEELYQTECRWIESILEKLLGSKLSRKITLALPTFKEFRYDPGFPKLLGQKVAAHYLGCTSRTIRTYIRKGELTKIKGGKVRCDDDKWARVLRSRRPSDWSLK